ncbi:hypothetical protein CHUAL_007563 [Chamberlinius hualienensis]
MFWIHYTIASSQVVEFHPTITIQSRMSTVAASKPRSENMMAPNDPNPDNKKPYSCAIRPLLRLNAIFGYNIQGNQQKRWLLDTLFTIQIFISVVHIIYGCAKAELDPSNIQKVMQSLQYIFNGMFNLVIKIAYRMACPTLAKLISNADKLLIQIQDDGDRYSRLLRLSGKLLSLHPPLMLFFHYVQVVEIYLLKSKNSVEVGDRNYQQLSRKYNLEIVYHFCIFPFTYTSNFLPLLTMVPVFIMLNFTFSYLNTRQIKRPNDVIKIVRLHGEACRFLKLADKVFNKIYLLLFTLLLFLTLVYVRIAVVPGQPLSYSSFNFVLACFIWISCFVMIPSAVNKSVSICKTLKVHFDHVLTNKLIDCLA